MNKKTFGVLVVLLFLLLVRVGVAAPPSFDSIQTVSLQGNFPAHADPAILFTDWDGDGLKDLLAAVYHGDGNSSLTRVQFYKNEGSKKSPSFTYVEDLKDTEGSFVTPHWY